MTVLMTYAGSGDPHARVTRTGGVPLAPVEFDWPRCAACGGAMQFLAQLLLDDTGVTGSPQDAGGALAVFMCQNDPGLCDEWDPAAGGNATFLFRDGELAPMSIPEQGRTLLGAVNRIAYVTVDTDDYDEARDRWAEETGRSPLEVLGQRGGVPSWVQDDETPACPSCSAPMHFVLQLEEGPDHPTAMNFGGGGSAYVFTCEPCVQTCFLWQC